MDLSGLTPLLTGLGAGVAAFVAARSGEKRRLEEKEAKIRKDIEGSAQRAADRETALILRCNDLEAAVIAMRSAGLDKREELATRALKRAAKTVPKADLAKLLVPSELLAEFQTAPAPLVDLPSHDAFHRNKPFEVLEPIKLKLKGET